VSGLLWRAGLSMVAPAGPNGRLSILIFHRVLAAKDTLLPDLPDAAEFEQSMSWVRQWFNVLPLRDAVQRLFDGTIAGRALAITFDDGYADNVEIAAPVLRRLGLPATFFVATGFMNGSCMWNDRVIEAIRSTRRNAIELPAAGLQDVALATPQARREAIGRVLSAIKHREQSERDALANALCAQLETPPVQQLMMGEDQLRRLHAMGMEIGAHTVSHPILTRLPALAAHAEIQASKERLEQIVQAPVRLFAYPNGVPNQDYGVEHAQMVRDCGFDAAVSTAWGAASRRSDRFQLPRFTPWDATPWRYAARMGANLLRREEEVAR
jgi:peptidoglycan/xylan/chitin deacetylase (PgdA/CDA1 family)